MRKLLGQARHWAALPILCCLCACSAGRAAEKQYDIVEKTGDQEEMCRWGKAVAAGYLKDGNEDAYKEWKTKSDIQCFTYEIQRNYGH